MWNIAASERVAAARPQQIQCAPGAVGVPWYLIPSSTSTVYVGGPYRLEKLAA